MIGQSAPASYFLGKRARAGSEGGQAPGLLSAYRMCDHKQSLNIVILLFLLSRGKKSVTFNSKVCINGILML